MEGSA